MVLLGMCKIDSKYTEIFFKLVLCSISASAGRPQICVIHTNGLIILPLRSYKFSVSNGLFIYLF